MTEPEIDELARRVIAGDGAAGPAFDARVRAGLERFCRGYVGDYEAAKDLAAEAIARFLERDSPPDRVVAWLRRVARNLCLDHRRERGARAAEPVDSQLAASLTGPLTRLARADEQRALLARLDRLSADERELLRLRYVDELARDEIAELLDWRPSQVKSRIYEALRKLRDG